MINVSKSNFVVRWFLYWNMCWAEFTTGRGVLVDDERTNLCTFFWVSVAAPVLILSIHGIVLAFAIYVLVIYGIEKLTWQGLLIEVGILGGFVGSIYLVFRFFGWAAAVNQKRRRNKPAPVEKADARWSFFELLGQYILAVHARTCPIIKVEG